MKIYELNKLDTADADKLCSRKAISFKAAGDVAESIISRVKQGGDSALKAITGELDGVSLNSLVVAGEEIESAGERLEPKTKQALEQAARNIEKFHKGQTSTRKEVETMPGVICFSESRPIDKVGLYVPGGTAPLPSTVLMLAIPAKLAGCREVAISTPPLKDGSIPDSILYAAYICGVKTIYKLGGAQAIAAMAYGSQTVRKTYKIFGPGNQYVTAAKMRVSIDSEGAAIDMPAGPTELLVIAGEEARADFIAADLLSQAEHGVDSQVVLVCQTRKKAEEIIKEIEIQLADLPRKKIASQALNNSFVVVVENLDQAIEFSNRFAPEHLILNVNEPEKLINKIINAGSVFLGQYSCESAGDYASGTNHSLPTYGYARSFSGVSVASFQKQVTFQNLTADGVKNIGPVVTELAELESLEAHKRAMEIRMEALR